MKKILPMLENYKTIAKDLIEKNHTHNEQLNFFLSFLLPEYEKNCLSEYLGGNIDEGKIIFSDGTDNKMASLKQNMKEFFGKSEYSSLYEMIKFELGEIHAFNETYHSKEYFEGLKHKAISKAKDQQSEMSKVQQGKTTLKTLFSKKSKEENAQGMQQKIEETSKDIENLTFIVDIITALIGCVEVDRFKSEKENKYYYMLKSFAQFELEFAKAR